jgi:hypothetical protein
MWLARNETQPPFLRLRRHKYYLDRCDTIREVEREREIVLSSSATLKVEPSIVNGVVFYN